MADFFVYILECADGAYDTGHTDNLDQRIGKHLHCSFDGYTSLRRPVPLLWSCQFPTPDEAFAFERRVKNWSRAKKQALIAGDWPALQRAAMPPGERDLR